MENRPKVLACYFNLVTAMSQIQLPIKTPLDYIRELIWDDTMQQDRLFAWADPTLIDQVIQATAQGEFSHEVLPNQPPATQPRDSLRNRCLQAGSA